ncbi:Cyclic nucleotide-binding domain-containing protein 1 [Desmophyllum pertusum]|uniref:Cyclic nucleotide-binding domain-containing protein 1 n=1 Tax=Desmophyllum pertusum TaxID=174260 RepID=A0A9W9YPH8_9CNID|nr:Cyclic nucleotide-binding domain-containing protein 1 [Desmophyllum pertusum]
MKTLKQSKHDPGGWSAKFGEETRKQRHPLPKLVGLPDINYSGMQWLCGIEGLGERDRPSTSEAHTFFLANYPKMFNKPGRQQALHLSLDSTQQRKLNFGDGQVLKAQETKIPHDKGLFAHWCEGFNVPVSHKHIRAPVQAS